MSWTSLECHLSFPCPSLTQKPGGNPSPSDTDALVKLFDDQVAKLEAI
jgi:hypothetical protein